METTSYLSHDHVADRLPEVASRTGPGVLTPCMCALVNHQTMSLARQKSQQTQQARTRPSTTEHWLGKTTSALTTGHRYLIIRTARVTTHIVE